MHMTGSFRRVIETESAKELWDQCNTRRGRLKDNFGGKRLLTPMQMAGDPTTAAVVPGRGYGAIIQS
jgi:hypothetical protein